MSRETKLIPVDLGNVSVWRIPFTKQSPTVTLSKPVRDGVHKRGTAFVTLMVPTSLDLPEAREFRDALSEAIEVGEQLEGEWRSDER